MLTTGECRRHAPISATALSVHASAANEPELEPDAVAGRQSMWPRTRPDEWCGEWLALEAGATEANPTAAGSMPPIAAAIATRTFLSRVAPGIDMPNSKEMLEALLNQLPPDVRRVIVRLNGLDGQPLGGLRETARELRMSREQVRVLQGAGDKRLAEAVAHLIASLPKPGAALERGPAS